MDDFLTKLAYSGTDGTSADTRFLGKKAAARVASGGVESLNEAVREIADAEHLNREQISRVVEQANQATWQANLSQGRPDAQFELADVDTVANQIATKPEVTDLTYADYEKDVENQSPTNDDLVFPVSTLGAETNNLAPGEVENHEVSKVASAKLRLELEETYAVHDLARKGEAFYGIVKEAFQDGVGILQLSKVAADFGFEDKGFALDAMTAVSSRLEGEGHVFDLEVEQTKVAQRVVVDKEHPLFKAAAELEAAARKYQNIGIQAEQVKTAHKKALEDLRKAVVGAL